MKHIRPRATPHECKKKEVGRAAEAGSTQQISQQQQSAAAASSIASASLDLNLTLTLRT